MNYCTIQESTDPVKKAMKRMKKYNSILNEFHDSVDTVLKYEKDDKYQSAARSVTNIQITLNRYSLFVVDHITNPGDQSVSQTIKFYLRATKSMVNYMSRLDHADFDTIYDDLDDAYEEFSELLDEKEIPTQADNDKYSDIVMVALKQMNRALYHVKTELMLMDVDNDK